MRPLDGHINRVLEGKTLERVTKDGQFLTLWMTNGERWSIAWTTPHGEGYVGEPCLVRVDVSVVAPSVGAFGACGAA